MIYGVTQSIGNSGDLLLSGAEIIIEESSSNGYILGIAEEIGYGGSNININIESKSSITI